MDAYDFRVLCNASAFSTESMLASASFSGVANSNSMERDIALMIRRLHDIGKSGWYYFICLVPVVGCIILIYFVAQPSDPNPNQYGDPAV